jgi:Rod binding domain-containing protein
MLEMMDFTHKDEVISKVKENGTLYEMLLLYQQLSLELAKKISPEEADLVAQQINSMLGGSVSIPTGESEVVSDDSKEHPFVERSRETARQSTQVD